MAVELGVIEGFYGKPWTWEERADTITFLSQAGYRFYHYAPKGDPYLRRSWMEPYPDQWAERLKRLADHCSSRDVRFGVGLSPYEIYLDFTPAAREALSRKLAFLDELKILDLAILFDDMSGGDPQLASRQLEIIDWIAERTRADRLIVCPTYYSDDPVLDRVFGRRPERYLSELGARLDISIQIFWTGEEVVSREISVGHLQRVGEMLGRKPFLWDNYPVNDGQRMSQFLHLRSFTGRPAAIDGYVAAHGINGALQPVLTRVPALTLVESYRRGEDYRYGEAFRSAAQSVLGRDLGQRVHEDLLTLQDIGLDRLGEKGPPLRERYTAFDHPGAREIVAWLDGEFRITDEIVHTQ